MPASWEGSRIVVRCDAATHRGTVWIGDVQVAEHAGGYTPFEADVTRHVRGGESFRITIRINNELTLATIPPGTIAVAADGRKKQRYFHDFFNYSGLHRSVWLYKTPHAHVADLAVTTGLDPQAGAGLVSYHAEVASEGPTSAVLRDAAGAAVAEGEGGDGVLVVPGVRPWHPGDPYLYQLEVEHGAGAAADRYPLPVGIRTVHVDAARLMLNGQPVRLRGFGMHEYTALRGKGHDDARMVRDFALLTWIGANSFRTSHYPYAEEVLDYADRHGLLVIDETPAVGLHFSLGHMGDPGARTLVPARSASRPRPPTWPRSAN